MKRGAFYPIEQFVRDFQWLLTQKTMSGDLSSPVALRDVEAYFSEFYLDPHQRSQRLAYIEAASRWFDSHESEWEELGVVRNNGDGTATLHRNLAFAVAACYCNRPPQELQTDLPAVVVYDTYLKGDSEAQV